MKFYRKKTTTKKAHKKKAPIRKVSTAVKSYVKKTLHRAIENKKVFSYVSNNAVVGPYFIQTLSPLISQGTGEAGRIGNTVTLVSAKVSFIINLVPYNVTTNPFTAPIMFRWMLVSQRSNNSASFSFTDFFEINNASTVPQGNHLDQLLAVNSQLFQVHKQGKFRLGTSSNSNSFTLASTYYEAGKVSIEKNLYFNKYLHKKLRFDDTATTPSNTNLWLIIFTTYANGSSSSTYNLANISFVITHEYEDA